MNAQLSLFAEPAPNGKKRGGSHPKGPVGLLRALQRQGLTPDATAAAARLIALLDEDAAGER